MAKTLVEEGRAVGTNFRDPAQGSRIRPGELLPAVPVGLVVIGLLATIWPDGAFALRRWALLTLLVMGVLIVGALTNGGVRRPPALGAALLWGFAVWAALSMIWAQSADLAWETAGRSALYAGLVTLPALALPRRRDAGTVGALLIAGLAAVVAIALITTAIRGEDVFVAGRLNSPLDYRNGVAMLMAAAAWPLVCTAAAPTLPGALRITGGALAGGALGLGYLTQSRGTIIALVIGGIAVLALGPDRRRRFWIAVALAAGVAALAHSLNAPYHAFVDAQADFGPALRTAARAVAGLVILGAAVGGVAWLWDRARPGAGVKRTAHLAGDIALAVLVVAGIAAGIAKVGNPVSYANDKVHEFKTLEPATATSSRLGSVGGQRYDLWRIALDEWKDKPLQGVGAGSYAFGYFQHRKTNRNLSDAHSLPLTLLSETGLVGFLLFAGGVVAILVAIARGARRLAPESRRWPAALAGVGMAVLGQSLVDWPQLLPGLFGLALLGLALAARMLGDPDQEAAAPAPADRGGQLRFAMLGRVAPIIPALVAVVGVALLYMADARIREARAARTPHARLDDAKGAAGLNPASITPLYLEAGAEEELGRPGAARARLVKALHREPDNFATLGLLGDFELRQGDRAAAHRWYRRALQRNPLDVGLQDLVRRTS
jgi:O-Antigen ligase